MYFHITCLKGRILSNKLLAKTSTQPGETQCDVLLLRYLVQQKNTTPQHDCLLFSTETNVEKNNSALMIFLYWSVCFPRCPKPWLMKTLKNNKWNQASYAAGWEIIIGLMTNGLKFAHFELKNNIVTIFSTCLVHIIVHIDSSDDTRRHTVCC